MLADHRLAIERQRAVVHADVGELLVRADPQAMRSVLDNLVSNALKHTPDGGRLRISAGRAGDAIWIEVADSGPGIPAAEREEVFEPFHRGERDADLRGTGIGLTLSQWTIRAHGGCIAAYDAPEGGACLRIELPAEAACAS